LTTLWQDIAYGVRVLRKNLGFTVVAVLTLALGIGANTAIFSVIHTVLLKPLPYPDSDRLMILNEYSVHNGLESVSWLDYLDWRQQNRSFDSMAAYNLDDFNFTGDGTPEVVHAGRASSSFFPMLGATTILGRTFAPEDDRPGARRTTVLTYAFWRTRFGANPEALGKSVTLNGEPYTVIGVLHPDFSYVTGHQVDLFVPVGLRAADRTWLMRGNHEDLTVLAHLRPGASSASATSDMNAIMSNLEKEYPESNSGQRASVKSLYEDRLADARPSLLILLAGVFCVLLIASANVANLSLARAAGRQKEFALRAAIGADRPRIIRQLLTESVLLSLAGGFLGLLLATWLMGPLLRLAPDDIPRLSQTHLDTAVFLFTFGVALVSGILFGLAPAFHSSRIDLTAALRESGSAVTADARRQRLLAALLISEVAIAVVLVIVSGLLTRSLINAVAVNVGFRSDHLIALDVNLPVYKYKTAAQQVNALNQILERTRNLPSVTSASAAMCPPLVGICWRSVFIFDDRPSPTVADQPRSAFNSVEPRYFQTLGVPLLAGRWFTPTDAEKSTPVILINQTAANRWWPGQSPLGKRIKQGFPQDPGEFREIVGVVGDLKQDGPDQPQSPEIFLPATQGDISSFTMVARTAIAPLAVASSIEDIIHSVDPDQPVYHVKPMTQVRAESLARREFSALLLGLFGALALLLAAVGIYGVISYSVTQRTHEIGVRAALGAQTYDVLRLIVGQGAKLAAIGVALGVLSALAVTRLVSSLLFATSPNDPATFICVTVLLLLVAVAACYIPARRAMRVDPIDALRYE
jgi:putative ABC transport system permease protein